MRKNLIHLSTVAFFLLVQTMTSGQKTEVSVRKGLVKAQTAAGVATVDAGRKAVLTQDKEPVIGIDDPMVDELLKMYEWAKAEKQADKIRIDSVSIQILSMENDRLFKGAGLNEFANTKPESSNVCVITGTMILNNPKYYNLEGNLLSYELKKTSDRHGNYHIMFPEPVAPGDKFKFILVSDLTPSLGMWSDGLLWHHVMENNPRYCVNYFQQILPESAIFVDTSRDVVLIDTVDGRIAVTTRNYTGRSARGMVHTTFLWPQKDGTSITDLPEDYRGLGTTTASSIDKSETVNKLDSLPWDKAGEEIVLLYDEFVSGKVKDSIAWFILGLKLVGGDFWDEALDSFERSCDLSEQKVNPDYVASLIWQGHVHDVQQRRAEAVSVYESTLAFLEQFRNTACISDFENYIFMRHDQWGIKLNYRWVKDRTEEPFTEDMLQIDAPSEKMLGLQERLGDIAWDGAGSEVIALYEECIADEKIAESDGIGGGWGILGLKLIGGGYWDEALDTFERSYNLSDSANWEFTSLVWQGHVYDIRGERDEAISRYEQALEVEDFRYMRHDQWGIVLDYEWARDRLKEPFTKEMVGK